MGGINFKGVEEAKEKVMTRPGTIGVFKISDVKFGTTKNKGTYYMGVTFSRKEDEFQHSFFLSQAALPRIVSLVKHAAGVKLDDDNVLEEKLITLLKGKDLALKVTGRIDETSGRAYADLSFGGFSKEPARIDELAFSQKEIELNHLADKAYAAGAAAKPEAATTTSGVAGAIPPPVSDEEIF
jgi:hypothetical protein